MELSKSSPAILSYHLTFHRAGTPSPTRSTVLPARFRTPRLRSASRFDRATRSLAYCECRRRGPHETLPLDAGVPVHVVAARYGHDPAVLPRSYAKRTKKADTSAANITGTLFKGMLR